MINKCVCWGAHGCVCVCVFGIWGDEEEEWGSLAAACWFTSNWDRVFEANVTLRANLINVCGCGLCGTVPVGPFIKADWDTPTPGALKHTEHSRRCSRRAAAGGLLLFDTWIKLCSRQFVGQFKCWEAHDVMSCKLCYHTDKRQFPITFWRQEVWKWEMNQRKKKAEVKETHTHAFEHTHTHTRNGIPFRHIYVHMRLRLRVFEIEHDKCANGCWAEMGKWCMCLLKGKKSTSKIMFVFLKLYFRAGILSYFNNSLLISHFVLQLIFPLKLMSSNKRLCSSEATPPTKKCMRTQ